MKSESSSGTGFWVSGHPIEPAKRTIFHLPLLAIAALLMFATEPAKAQITNSLLVNASYLANSGQKIPTGWTYFEPKSAGASVKDYWVVNQASEGNGSVVPAQSGTNFWKQWNVLYSATSNNVDGIYQTFSATPGSIYQADGWITSNPNDVATTNDAAWVQVEFLDGNSNLLALYKSDSYSSTVGSTNWSDFPVTNTCDITQPVSTGDPYFTTYAITGSVSQLVAPSGTVFIRYRYCALFALGDGGSVYFDTPALEQVSGPVPPVINNLNPQNEIFVPPSSGLSFNVSSPSGFTINNSGIQVVLNGSNNVSSGLVITGSASSKNVSYSGLQSNMTYNATISVTDVSNLTTSANTTFETTWVGVPAYTYLWLAADFDFSGGMYIDNPDLCNAPGNSDCYFGQTGLTNVDESSTGPPPAQYYRGTNDTIGVQPSGDFSRPDLTAAGRVDYCINPFNGNPAYSSGAQWVNYTRDWTNSTNWIVARLATGEGFSGSIQMSVVNPGVSTNVLGSFTINSGAGWTTFEFVYLISTDGVSRASVVLNGKETLEATSGGNLLPSFYMLVPAQPDAPILSNLYPTGKHPFEATNALHFTVTTGAGATFPHNGIQVLLDGYNVSSNLVITGSTSSNDVVYPYLETNQTHLAIITATNSLGHGITLTNQFDTFTATNKNYIVQAEDYDYNGGQFITTADYQPDCYANLSAVPEVDFHHTILVEAGEPTDGSDFAYRNTPGIPEELTPDYPAILFLTDYNLYWYGGGDWANYTRDYPNGPFNVYIRTAGLGQYTLDLSEVIGGLGTTNQTLEPLGQFSSIGGVTITNFAWVPLTDAGGVAPVTVNITGGTNTFQLSTPTGDCYPNYFMLVPASSVRLSAAVAGNNVNLSFLTRTGGVYRVFYRTNLTAGNWTLLNSVLGSGSMQSVADSTLGGNVRFYKVTSP